MRPTVEKIEVFYLGSLYEDLYKNEPLLASINQLPGIKIGHLVTDPPFMGILMARMGFYELADLDFIIGDIIDMSTDSAHIFFIPKAMGYANDNYKGIRFAVLSRDRDSLVIADETQIALIKQRSDILWIIDKGSLNVPPMKIDFFIKDRQLSDTTVSAIRVKPDTGYLEKLEDFRNGLDVLLNAKLYLENKRLDEYLLSKIASREDVDVILYPENLFHGIPEKDSISFREILNDVACELKFEKAYNMADKDIVALSKEKNYLIWRAPTKNTRVLLPSDKGTYLFDLICRIKYLFYDKYYEN